MNRFLVFAACLLVFALQGCGGCEGQSGESMFGKSCGAGDASGAGGGSVLVASGRGPDTVILPNGTTAVLIEAQTSENANFAVRVDGRLVANELLGPRYPTQSFAGTYPASSGSRVEIFMATGVAWSVSTVQPDTAGNQRFSKSGVGDSVFVLPPRSSRYTVTGRYTLGGTTNFAVRVGGRLVVNEIIGAAGFTAAFQAASQEQVEVFNAAGVAWTFTEN